MSHAKDLIALYEQRKFRAVPDKVVCDLCVNDPAWKAWIIENAKLELEECDYGDSAEEANGFVTLEDFITHCMEFINSKYSRAEEDEDIYPDSETGEYPVDTWDTWDLVHEILAEEAGIEHEELLKDISKTIDNTTWCRIHPFEDED